MHRPTRTALALTLCLASPLVLVGRSLVQAEERPDLGDHVVLSWNDLGMHCMNETHEKFSILPPYNNIYAQVIRRGDATQLPELLETGVQVEYSIPGNTYSVGKTDFWDYDVELFGVDLPPDIGLTGKGLVGELDPLPGRFVAEGVPITPFPDATPTIEDPYQQAHLIARNSNGDILAESHPVLPVSTELRCVSSGCHSSEQAILDAHPNEDGFDPNGPAILCASCHASPALGTTGDPEAGYFSFRIHDQHKFLDEEMPGMDGCYTCHPGVHARCLRGTMGTDYGMECQDCHGDMRNMAETIEHQGRVPWLDEPACGSCHTAQYGEPEGQLYRLSTGHGGVMCSGCHNSPHAIYPSGLDRDNANVVALQGSAGTLSDCTVCHGVVPSGEGPHGLQTSGVPGDGPDLEAELLGGSLPIAVSPNPMVDSARFSIPAGEGDEGKLLVFDASGRTLSLFKPQVQSDGSLLVEWQGEGRKGQRVGSGVYFLRWQNGVRSAGGKVIVR